jgi:hypothetical protein
MGDIVRNVKMNSNYIVVATEKKVYAYDLNSLKCLTEIHTSSNIKGALKINKIKGIFAINQKQD